MKTMYHKYIILNIYNVTNLQVNMDSTGNEFISLNCPVEVIDNSDDKCDVSDEKRKGKDLLC